MTLEARLRTSGLPWLISKRKQRKHSTACLPRASRLSVPVSRGCSGRKLSNLIATRQDMAERHQGTRNSLLQLASHGTAQSLQVLTSSHRPGRRTEVDARIHSMQTHAPSWIGMCSSAHPSRCWLPNAALQLLVLKASSQ